MRKLLCIVLLVSVRLSAICQQLTAEDCQGAAFNEMSVMAEDNDEADEWVSNYADLKRIDEVRRCIYDSFSWRNIDVDWVGRIVIRFVLTPEYTVENIRLWPKNVTPEISEELIRCIENIDFRKLSYAADTQEKVHYIFPYDLFKLLQYEE